MIPLSESMKWRFREVKLPVQGPTACEGWGWYPSPDVWVTNPDSRLPPRSEAAPVEKGEDGGICGCQWAGRGFSSP